jgi:hypothetical protein
MTHAVNFPGKQETAQRRVGSWHDVGTPRFAQQTSQRQLALVDQALVDQALVDLVLVD